MKIVLIQYSSHSDEHLVPEKVVTRIDVVEATSRARVEDLFDQYLAQLPDHAHMTWALHSDQISNPLRVGNKIYTALELVVSGRPQIFTEEEFFETFEKMTLKLGTRVAFNPKVFEAPYAPYYDAYKGNHTFIVLHESNQHYLVHCEDDPSIVVKGYVHDDELEAISEGHELQAHEYLKLYRFVPPRFEDDEGGYERIA